MSRSFGSEYYPIKPKRYEYFLVWVLLAITGFTYFYMLTEFYWISIFIVLSIHFYHKKKIDFSKRFILISSLFLFIEIIQGVIFDFKILSILNLLSRFVFVYLIIESTGQNFIYHYVRIMYFLAWSSLIIYLSLYLEPIQSFLWFQMAPLFQPIFRFDETYKEVYEISSNIIIYTFNKAAMNPPLRNSGAFWEPGGFSVFLIFALFFNLLIEKKFLTKRNIIFVLALVSTLSTAGYLGLFILITGYIVTSKMFLLKKIFLIIPFAILVVYLWTELEFLETKVETNKFENYTTTSRFGSAIEDLIMVKDNMIFGTGRNFMTVYKTKMYDIGMHRNNGVTQLLRQYGIPIFIFYLFLLFRIIRSLNTKYGFPIIFTVFVFLSILTIGFAQTIFLLPFPLILLFFESKHLITDSKDSDSAI